MRLLPEDRSEGWAGPVGVPLSPRATAIVSEMAKRCAAERVRFAPGGRGIAPASNMTMAAVLRRMKTRRCYGPWLSFDVPRLGRRAVRLSARSR